MKWCIPKRSMRMGVTNSFLPINRTYLNNATIKNLQTEGWVRTSGHRPANIAVYADGTSTISNCTCGASIESTLKSSWVDGGAVVACIKSGATLNITDCYARASVYYEGTAYSGGGVVGWTEDATAMANLERCVYNPTFIEIEKKDNDPHYFVSGPGQKTLNKCFYNKTAEESVLTAEGTSWEVYYNTENLWNYLGWNLEDRNLPKEVTAASLTIESPVIENVTIDCDETPIVNFDGGQFIGSYSPVALPVNDRTNLFLGAKNTLYWPSGTNYEDFPDLNGANSSNFYLGSCRAYFHIGSPSGVRAFVLNFDEHEQTGIKTIFADDRKPGSSNAATGIYILDGRRVATDFDKQSPYNLPKGVYIVNGRKVAIK